MRSSIKVLAAGAAADAPAGPVANISNLQGEKTEVILDQSFLDGLKSLKLTPGVLGKATLKSGTLAFPITGGAATYYTPGSREPYVESTIFHDGSGISLTDGKTKVDLTDGAAKLLDQTYKTDALKENFQVGTARITLKLPKS
jgi:hypothetical protein